jgi:hypothetical protein
MAFLPETSSGKPITKLTGTTVGAKHGADVNVLGTVTTTTTPATSTAGTPAGFTVSTSAVLLAALNTSRKSIIVTNNSTGKLYLGHTSGVTTSGANMGLVVPAGGSYTDSGFGLYTGTLYGIYDTAAGSQNVSVSERT